MTGPTDATIRWRYRDANGVAVATVIKNYVRDATYQVSVSALLGVNTVPNGSLEATIQAGQARAALSPVNNINNQGRWIDFKFSSAQSG